MTDTDRLAAIRSRVAVRRDANLYPDTREQLDAEALLAEVERLTTERQVLLAKVLRLRGERKEATAERDRARDTAVRLEQEAAVAEEARQVWAATAQQQLAEARAALEHERSLTRRLATDNIALAAAIQRVRAEHHKIDGDLAVGPAGAPMPDFCSDCNQVWPCDTISDLDGEVPDGD